MPITPDTIAAADADTAAAVTSHEKERERKKGLSTSER